MLATSIFWIFAIIGVAWTLFLLYAIFSMWRESKQEEASKEADIKHRLANLEAKVFPKKPTRHKN